VKIDDYCYPFFASTLTHVNLLKMSVEHVLLPIARSL
jgi:hypothetical protein